MTDSNTNAGITKDSTLIPKLTTLTNQRVTSSTLTISDLIPMIDYNTSMGLSRDSTLILDPPVYNGDVTIEQNGTYLPEDFNSNGEYDPTHSANYDYINTITVSVTPQPTVYNLSDFYCTRDDGTDVTYFNNWQIVPYDRYPIVMNNNDEVIMIRRNPDNVNNTFLLTIKDWWNASWTEYLKKDDIYAIFQVKLDGDGGRRYITKFWNNGKALMRVYFYRYNIASSSDPVVSDVTAYYDGVINVDV